jgi:hypothetical protein
LLILYNQLIACYSDFRDFRRSCDGATLNSDVQLVEAFVHSVSTTGVQLAAAAASFSSSFFHFNHFSPPPFLRLPKSLEEKIILFWLLLTCGLKPNLVHVVECVFSCKTAVFASYLQFNFLMCGMLLCRWITCGNHYHRGHVMTWSTFNATH